MFIVLAWVVVKLGGPAFTYVPERASQAKEPGSITHRYDERRETWMSAHVLADESCWWLGDERYCYRGHVVQEYMLGVVCVL